MDLMFLPSQDFVANAVSAIIDALDRCERPCIGLASGATPIPVYHQLLRTDVWRFVEDGGTFTRRRLRSAEVLARARPFAIDEYVWPNADHPGTNASFFREHWPDELDVPPVALPRADAADPRAEIAAHCREIDACGGFDVVVLGIGRNGHIAFNEPGSARGSNCRVQRLAKTTREGLGPEWSEKPLHGMTVGVRQIMAARHLLLLATGAAKRQVIRDAIAGPMTSDLPASFLQEHPWLKVICDWDAGRLVHEATDILPREPSAGSGTDLR